MNMCGKRVIIFVNLFWCFLYNNKNVLGDISNGRNTYPITRTQSRKNCDTDQIDYKLSKLELSLFQKNENLNSEIRNINSILQSFEYQQGKTQRSIETLSSDVTRLSGYCAQNGDHQASQMHETIENISKGVHIIVAVLRELNSDLYGLKNNVSKLINITNSLLDNNQNNTSNQPMKHSLHEKTIPKNCHEVPKKQNGIYLIQPTKTIDPFMVKCDQERLGGGWTYIQNRQDGSQNFYKNFDEYKAGFGNLAGEFFLGLEKIHQLTNTEVNELLIELEDFDNATALAHYSHFGIGSEIEGYSLKILGDFSGSAGDSLKYHAGMKFSTKDVDSDEWVEGSCSQSHTGAWWYNSCDMSNLNGKYFMGEIPDVFAYQGMYWNDFKGPQYSLKSSKIMIRPRNSVE